MGKKKEDIVFEDMANTELDKTNVFRSFNNVFDGVRTKAILVQFKKTLEILHL